MLEFSPAPWARYPSPSSPCFNPKDDSEGAVSPCPPRQFSGRHKVPAAKSRQKESHFLYKCGQKLHQYDVEKAPYPMSYDRQVLELEAMSTHFVHHTMSDVTFINFPSPPKISLDLGCGTGVWAIEAAKHWPESQIIGFDLVDIQLPLSMVEPGVASRITWVHGNFLTTRLPFEDEVFDHVRMRHIAMGVPENKWGVLFEEVNRVLKPGGAIEISEDDIIFPTLPRWFTSCIRPKAHQTASLHLCNSSPPSTTSSPSSPLMRVPPHDHALLESLFNSVFEHRFVNREPTSILPNYLTTYFTQTYLSPQVSLRMPPVHPVQPLPPRAFSFTLYAESASDDCMSTTSSTPTTPRPASLSFSPSAIATALLAEEFHTPPQSPPPLFTEPQERDDQSLDSSEPWIEIDRSASYGFAVPGLETRLLQACKRSLVMHLYRSYQNVLGCQEAMWDELNVRIRNTTEQLVGFGWEDDDQLQELQERERFERLVERYKSDMLARLAFWCTLVGMGWPFPASEPLFQADMIEKMRVQHELLQARQHALQEGAEPIFRTIRVLVGFKDN